MTEAIKENLGGTFLEIARRTQAQRRGLVIWTYCPTCWTQTHQNYVRDEGRYEVYKCDTCNCEHTIAVR